MDALHVTKKARPVVAPNSGFMRQLHEYSERLGLHAHSFSLVSVPKFAGFVPSPHDTQLAQERSSAGAIVDGSQTQ